MSVNSPPNPNITTFNNEYWVTSNVALTQADADLRYLKFPVAQGTETFSILTTNTPTVGDNTTTVPNTSWVQTAITNAIAAIPAIPSLLGLNNIWTGTNSFSNTTAGSLTSSATQPSATDNSTIVPTTAWVQTAISPNVTFLAIGTSLTLGNQDYIFLTGSGAGGGTLTLPVSTNGRQITVRKVGGTGVFNIAPDTANSVSLYDHTIASANFVMTTNVISSVTLCFTTFTNQSGTLIQAWLVIAVNKV